MKSMLADALIGKFVSENIFITIIFGLIAILSLIGVGTSLVMIFINDYWWKLLIASVGAYLLNKKIVEIVFNSWITKLKRSNK